MIRSTSRTNNNTVVVRTVVVCNINDDRVLACYCLPVTPVLTVVVVGGSAYCGTC